jgi:proliferating cell nuclear antigen
MKNRFENSNDILIIETVQVSAFKILITALKDILIETNIQFKDDGIHIINMDKSNTILVNMHLKSNEFEFYRCDKEKIIIGVNLFQLYRLISNIKTLDTLTILIDKNDYCDGIVESLTIITENSKQRITKKLKLIEPDHDELEFPEIKYSSILNFPSQDFQEIIKHLASLSSKVEIQSIGNKLIFKSCGLFSQITVERNENERNEHEDEGTIIQGEYSLKNLLYIIKCTNLCPQIEIYLENDLPLIILYKVASLGDIKMCLVQTNV